MPDYDHLVAFARLDVVQMVDNVGQAVELIRESAHTDDFQAFFGLIALRTAIANRN